MRSTAPTPGSHTEALRTDLDLLTELHEQVLAEAGGATLVETVRTLVDACRPDSDSPPASDEPSAPRRSVADILDGLDARAAAEVARAVTVHLHLTNLADERQRARSLRAEDGEFTGGVEAGGIGPAIRELSNGSESVVSRLESLRIHPVLTAHPTEARRRAVTSALVRIANRENSLGNR